MNYTFDNSPSAIGFVKYVDAVCFKIKFPSNLIPAGNNANELRLKQSLRWLRFKEEIKNNKNISSNEFLNGWISEIFLMSLAEQYNGCLLYTSPSPRDGLLSRMPSSA